MKPLKLTLTAFGPYKDKEIVDFTKLEDHSLFIISGKTGAGKTTIFDGICFALYGSASGSDRENMSMLRSDFADDDVHTSVELVFELNRRTYRIKRQLGHIKHGNKTKTGEKYEFYEQKDGKEIPCVDRQIVSDINQKVESLLGLTQDQFKQIVMLPQGEFRKLLTSETENKETILRKIFKTKPYQEIAERLKTKRDLAAQAYQVAKDKQDSYLQGIQNVLPVREDSQLQKVLQEEYYNGQQVLLGLDEEIAHYHKQIEVDKEKYESAYQMHGKKQTIYYEAKNTNEQFDRLEEKTQRLAVLSKQETSIRQKENRLAEALRASKITPFERQVADASKEETNKIANRNQAVAALEKAEKNLTKMQQEAKIQDEKKPERETIGKKLNQYLDLLPIVKDVNQRKQQIASMKKQLESADKELEKTKHSVADKQKAYEELAKKVKQLDEKVSTLPQHQQQLIDMRDQARVLGDYLKAYKHQNALKEELQRASSKLENAKTQYEKVEQAWLSNQASVLAAHLHEGDACPVCGSIWHGKQTAVAQADVTKEQLQSAKESYQQLERKYHSILADVKYNQNVVEQSVEALKAFNIPTAEADEKYRQLVEAGKKQNQLVEQLKKDAKQLREWKEEQDTKQEIITKLNKNKEQLEQKYHTLKTDHDRSVAVYEEKMNMIPENVRKLSVLEDMLAKLEQKKNEMEKAAEAAKNNLDRARDAYNRAQSDAGHAENQLTEAKKRKEKAQNLFQTAIRDAEFSSEEAYMAAKMEEKQQHQLQMEIQQFRQEQSTLNEQIRELQQLLQDRQRTDLVAIEQQLQALKQKYEQALEKWQQSKDYFENARDLKTNIQEAAEKVAASEKQLSIIADLHDVIRGQNSQKISFERFLQMEYLEQIIEAANHRLKNMSNGQFMLIRSKRQESRGKQSGLSIDVFDSYTGQTRDVKTLSGGEKFNASLCLALGMADVIQSFQGNISIQTMFIDEGFGTLDEESLNKAIDTLVDLQKSGRMIGVISHVRELKDVFPAILEVAKSKEGVSHTKFVVK